MNRRELVRAIAAHTEMDPREVDKAVKGFTEVVTAIVAQGEPVAITGFAKFSRRETPAGTRMSFGREVKVKASKKARITPLKGFKDAVLTPKNAPKLAKGVWPADGGAAKTGGATKGGGAAKKASPAKKAAAKTAKR